MRNLIACLVCALLFSACSSDSDTFRLEGRLRNMNQGEFWVYSPDGGMAGIDTIKVREGRFAYELPLADEATLIIVFPNYSEQPVFASPGKTVSIKGDATHLKEMIIQGTKANEDMTSLRMELNDLTPPDIPEAAAAFIEKHPNSPASIFVLDRYLLLTPDPDFKDVLRLTKFLLKAQPENKYLLRLSKELLRLQGAKVGSPMPKFTATDIRGNKVTEAMLRADANVLLTWASWNFQSSGALQQLRMLKKRHGDRLAIVSICLDGNLNNCRQRVSRDSITWPTICDGRIWDTPLLSTFAIADVPDNVLIDSKGRIVARSMDSKQLEERINNLLK